MLCYTLMVLSGLLFSPADDDLKKVEGNWNVAAMEVGGAKLPESEVKKYSLTMKDGKYTVKTEGQGIDHGTSKMDSSAKPKTLDITSEVVPGTEKTMLGIYELSMDEYKVCFGGFGKPRPTSFATKKGEGQILIVYKRAK